MGQRRLTVRVRLMVKIPSSGLGGMVRVPPEPTWPMRVPPIL
jgi:hypothetical protein